LILPVPVRANLFLAPELVFTFGILLIILIVNIDFKSQAAIGGPTTVFTF
jgi:hypothetical protein